MGTDLGELHGKLWEVEDQLRANSGYSAGMGQPAAQLPLECWLDAALAGASTEEVRGDDGVLVGWWAENPECKGASAFGATPDEARSKLRQVLAGWVELGRQLGHPIPSFHNGIVAAPV